MLVIKEISVGDEKLIISDSKREYFGIPKNRRPLLEGHRKKRLMNSSIFSLTFFKEESISSINIPFYLWNGYTDLYHYLDNDINIKNDYPKIMGYIKEEAGGINDII